MTPTSPTTCPSSTSRASTTRRRTPSTFFAVNRHATEALELNVDLKGFGAARVIDHQVMTHADLKIANSLGEPERRCTEAGSGMAVDGGTLTGKPAALLVPDDPRAARLIESPPALRRTHGRD